MRVIKKFDNFINETISSFKIESVKWSIGPKEWSDVKHTVLLSHLSSSQRNYLLSLDIYDSNIPNPKYSLEHIWINNTIPKFFIIKYNTEYYLCHTQGYHYVKYVVRIDDFEKWFTPKKLY